MFIPGKNYAAAVLADKPLRYYRLGDGVGNTKAHDLGSQALDGTYSATGVTLAQTGLLVQDSTPCVLFDGVAGVVTLPQTGLPTGSHAWTIECWAQLPTTPGADFLPFMGFGTASNQEMAVLYLRTDLSVTLSTKSGDANSSPPGLFQIGAPAHLVGTYDGTTLIRLYVDGRLVASDNPGAMNIVLTFAAIANDSGAFVNADIQEAAIYNTALSHGRVWTHYLAGLNI